MESRVENPGTPFAQSAVADILDWTCRLKSAGNLFASKYYGHIGALDESNEQMVLGTEQLMTWTHK